MARIVLLDAGPIGLLCSRRGRRRADESRAWLLALDLAGIEIVISAVAEFEVRRELLRLGISGAAKLKNLDELLDRLDHLAPDLQAWTRASELWAFVRRAGKPTADPHALDADCILAAQASLLGEAGHVVTIATTNAGHLNRFPGIDAKEWDKLAP